MKLRVRFEHISFTIYCRNIAGKAFPVPQLLIEHVTKFNVEQ